MVSNDFCELFKILRDVDLFSDGYLRKAGKEIGKLVRAGSN